LQKSAQPLIPWLGLVALALAAVLPAVATPPPSGAAQAACLAAGLLLLVAAARDLRVRALIIPVAAIYGLDAVQHLPNPGVARFQLISLASVACLVPLTLAGRPRIDKNDLHSTRDALTLGLLLLAIAAASPLGVLAASVLLVEIAIVSPLTVRATPADVSPVEVLAQSGWPPAIAFAGRVLAMIATLQQSVALGMMAGAMVVGLQLSPLKKRQPARPQLEQPPLSQRVVPLVSLVLGFAPELLHRMLRL
jgi:hypothetical protein